MYNNNNALLDIIIIKPFQMVIYESTSTFYKSAKYRRMYGNQTASLLLKSELFPPTLGRWVFVGLQVLWIFARWENTGTSSDLVECHATLHAFS